MLGLRVLGSDGFTSCLKAWGKGNSLSTKVVLRESYCSGHCCTSGCYAGTQIIKFGVDGNIRAASSMAQPVSFRESIGTKAKA